MVCRDSRLGDLAFQVGVWRRGFRGSSSGQGNFGLKLFPASWAAESLHDDALPHEAGVAQRQLAEVVVFVAGVVVVVAVSSSASWVPCAVMHYKGFMAVSDHSEGTSALPSAGIMDFRTTAIVFTLIQRCGCSLTASGRNSQFCFEIRGP